MEPMKEAIDESFKGMEADEGGPFGAVITKDGKVIAVAHNTVIKTNDPTAHAEVNAIRKASQILNRFDLSDCEIYTSCEPCPMCLAAMHWAKLKKFYYACTRKDAEDIGFDDKFIYDVFEGKAEGLEKEQLMHEEALEAFKKWEDKSNKVPY